MRFVLGSDQYVNEDGFYFDEFQILYNEEDQDASITSHDLMDLKLMPNPTSSSAKVALPQVVSEGSIQIIDGAGKLVKTHSIMQQTNNVEIDVSDLDQGVYFVSYQGSFIQTNPVRLVVVK